MPLNLGSAPDPTKRFHLLRLSRPSGKTFWRRLSNRPGYRRMSFSLDFRENCQQPSTSTPRMGACLHAKPHEGDDHHVVGRSYMGDYRVYTPDNSGKATGPPFIVQCEDDGAALTLARLVADDQTREIWEGARRVATILGIKCSSLNS